MKLDCKKQTWGPGFSYPFIVFLFYVIGSQAQTESQTADITQNYDRQHLNRLIAEFEKEVSQKKIQLGKATRLVQWQSNEKDLDGTIVALNDIGDDGTLLFYTTLLDPTSKVSRANALHTNGVLDLDLDGTGMKVGVWDAGLALTTHQEFDGRVTFGDASEEIDSHATMVTGTLVSAGVKEKAKGVAFGASALSHDWSRDKIEVTEAAANGLLLSNHSYGIKTDRVPDWYFGSYIRVSQDWDRIMYNAPYYLMVTAAGNAQNSFDNNEPNFGKTADGFDLLLGFTTAKNGLVVAGAAATFNDQGKLKNAHVANYSSFGPIDDSRIKPDLAGDGTAIFSTSSNSDTSYQSLMGTSMATPGVTGSLLLLQQFHEDLYGNFMKAATLKGLALHTADDVAESGPDYKMGWGIINTQKAAEVLLQKDYGSLVEELKIEAGQSYSFEVNAEELGPLRASISWTDPEGVYVNRGDLNTTTKALINDLDLRITQNGTTYYPWKLNAGQADKKAVQGDNQVDPFERIDILNPSGTYTVTISHKGELKNGAQDVSLVVSGVRLSKCRLEAPKAIGLQEATEHSARFSWAAAEETLFEVQFKNKNSSKWSMRSTWENSMAFDDLEKGTTYEFQVRQVCTQNLASEFTEPISFEFEGTDTEITTDEPIGYIETAHLKVFPNPTVNELFVDMETSKDAQYTILSVAGTVVRSGILDGKVDVTDLPDGMYILNIMDYSGKHSTKFLKR
ncbi:MAG: S8 family serine peptidase [Flavobacteriaceae bacterium]|nr:S8 family serine peptidase [Flavobacteriaceae bacterium]